MPTATRLPVAGSWLPNAQVCPHTGLVGWPDFHRDAPELIARSLMAGRNLGLAIGDVDGLKSLAENYDLGHVAANVFMGQLGGIIRDWFCDQKTNAGCAACFGGDETLIVLQLDTLDSLIGALRDLQGRVKTAGLSRTVSFAAALLTASHLPETRWPGWETAFYEYVLRRVDRILISMKHARRGDASYNGFLTWISVPPFGTCGEVEE
ncbi:nucleotidyl cyclase domain-containing protein [Carbonactinospora thermoautotrophica]|uniref:GGDEF domain-containing protein n=1 Tax=Carbonactinospora thermoautotrophica TaxID=1469144 RepID=UPI000ADDFE6A|nr:GGDEF domain-containing protein [Carbonactinospora thermoautotrophica]